MGIQICTRERNRKHYTKTKCYLCWLSIYQFHAKFVTVMQAKNNVDFMDIINNA